MSVRTSEVLRSVPVSQEGRRAQDAQHWLRWIFSPNQQEGPGSQRTAGGGRRPGGKERAALGDGEGMNHGGVTPAEPRPCWQAGAGGTEAAQSSGKAPRKAPFVQPPPTPRPAPLPAPQPRSPGSHHRPRQPGQLPALPPDPRGQEAPRSPQAPRRQPARLRHGAAPPLRRGRPSALWARPPRPRAVGLPAGGGAGRHGAGSGAWGPAAR